ncbi:hypothetical protein FLACOL7796_02479 [Flavobacterium collinsii]|uniref:Uncharacterized protein n=1 Tax=Flavobacterium collinsii TaxID=1114861 RepID=A0ABN7EJZ3_9FLAO|nr:hypothetical protein FLACOL7796_02479 [Flavobacterium collinsii]
MKFFKSNSFYIMVTIFATLLFLVYVFNKGEIFGRALAR